MRAGAVLLPMYPGSLSPIGAEVAWFLMRGLWGAAGVWWHPIVGPGWGGLFALGVSPPLKDLPSKIALWVTWTPFPEPSRPL